MKKSEYGNIYFHEETHFFYRSTHDLIFRLLSKYSRKKNGRILDAGCGTGLLMKKMQTYGTIYGVDISEDAISFCKKRGLKNIFQADINNLPFDDNIFDSVVSIDVLYHKAVKSDREALAEFYRVLKPKGTLILKLPAFEMLRGNHDIVVKTKHRYKKGEVSNKLSNTGFKVQKVSYYFFFLFPIILLSRIILRFLKIKPSSEIEDINPFINTILYKMQVLETKLFLKSDLPFGISIIAVAKKP